MSHDMHGLTAGDRVVLANSEVQSAGKIVSTDEDAGTAWVKWDNGHDAFDVDIDELIPEEGW